MIRSGYEHEIILFTAEETITAREMVDIINETTGRQTNFDLFSREDFIRIYSMNHPHNKLKQYSEVFASWWTELAAGAARKTDPLMHEILGREPTKPRDAVRMLLEQNRDYLTNMFRLVAVLDTLITSMPVSKIRWNNVVKSCSRKGGANCDKKTEEAEPQHHRHQ